VQIKLQTKIIIFKTTPDEKMIKLSDNKKPKIKQIVEQSKQNK
jgi:hypothetical protein